MNPIDNEHPDIRDSLPDRISCGSWPTGTSTAAFPAQASRDGGVRLVFALLNDAVDTEHVVSETFLELSRKAGGIGESGESVPRYCALSPGRAQRCAPPRPTEPRP
jgi:hypothetical protein